MGFSWPDGFVRVPDEAWAKLPLEELALKYDTVEEHGWYDNLNESVAQITANHGENELLLDYSGGTGILTRRLYNALGDVGLGVLIVDSSPKFLRLAQERSKEDDRVGFRLIRYLREERRLQTLKEVIDPSIWDRGIDALASTNAIHLYYQLNSTLGSWHNLLRPGGKAYIQSGNMRNPAADSDSWIIDETVEHIHQAAVEIVKESGRYVDFQAVLNDSEYMSAHDKLRKKYFLPVRHVDHYEKELTTAGFSIDSLTHKNIFARVDEWFDFLAVYHEGVLGWIGGAQKVTGVEASEELVAIRLELMREAMDRIFEGRDTFKAVWTYFVCGK